MLTLLRGVRDAVFIAPNKPAPPAVSETSGLPTRGRPEHHVRLRAPLLDVDLETSSPIVAAGTALGALYLALEAFESLKSN